MPLRAIVDSGSAHSFIDPTTGFMLVINSDQQGAVLLSAHGFFGANLSNPAQDKLASAGFSAQGRFDARATVVRPPPQPRILTDPGDYLATNVMRDRIIIRKHR